MQRFIEKKKSNVLVKIHIHCGYIVIKYFLIQCVFAINAIKQASEYIINYSRWTVRISLVLSPCKTVYRFMSARLQYIPYFYNTVPAICLKRVDISRKTKKKNSLTSAGCRHLPMPSASRLRLLVRYSFKYSRRVHRFISLSFSPRLQPPLPYIPISAI